MTDGLQFLHARGIIHRDIKTPNILIDGAWRGKLCDYNFAIDEKSSIKQARNRLTGVPDESGRSYGTYPPHRRECHVWSVSHTE